MIGRKRIRTTRTRAALAAMVLIWTAVTGPTWAGTNDAPGSTATLFVVRRGWHVDVGFATAELQGPLAALAASFPGSRYLLFGFGDRRYLLSRHRHLSMLAALWPGRGMMLVTALTASPESAFGSAHVLQIPLPPEGAAAARRFVDRSFDRSGVAESDPPQALPAPGPYGGSAYYAARMGYSAVHTCNTWVAEVMRAAGLPVRTRGVVFAGQAWRQAQRLPAERGVSAGGL